MRRWILGGVLAVTVAVVTLFLVTRDSDDACVAKTVIDGSVQPGGPESADQALASFLSASAESYGITQTGVAGYRRSETNGTVTYATDDIRITAIRQANGWWIGAVELHC